MTIVERLRSSTKAWTVKEVAEALDCHIMTVYDWVEEGKIPHMRIGRRVKFDPSTIAEWIEKRSC